MREHANLTHPLARHCHSGIIPDSRMLRGNVEEPFFVGPRHVLLLDRA